MKKYKLIKEYPGSPKENFILDDSWKIKHGTCNHTTHFVNNLAFNPKDYPSYWEEVIEKDYKILQIALFRSIKYEITDISEYNYSDGYFEALLSCNGNKIHSIKRLSDGEIFTIGDNMGHNDILLEITLEDNKIKIWSCDNSYSCPIKGANYGFNFLENIKKYKQPLFITEDGVDIFEGDKFYTLLSDLSDLKITEINATVHSKFNKYLDFSTKEKAEEYILLNKPCLSYKDIENLKIDRQKRLSPKSLLEVKELVKQKLNK